MKTRILIFLIVIIVACKQKENEKNESRTSFNNSCRNLSDVPRDQKDLNKMANLQYNLDEQCRFQPLHVQMRDSLPSSELIGRFKGKKRKDGKFEIKQIELKFFEIADNPRMIVVSDANYEIENDTARLVVSLLDVTECDTNDCETRRRRRTANQIDFKYDKKPIILTKNQPLDITIKNEGVLYTEQHTFIPRGRQCNGIAVYN